MFCKYFNTASRVHYTRIKQLFYMTKKNMKNCVMVLYSYCLFPNKLTEHDGTMGLTLKCALSTIGIYIYIYIYIYIGIFE